MMMRILLVILVGIFLPQLVVGLESLQKQCFDLVMRMNMAELTAAADELLQTAYGDTKWTAYNFPGYVNSSPAVRTAYRLAAIEPELLAGLGNDEVPEIPCYCSCESFGHKSLLWCFLREGSLEKGFDEHGSQCNICYGQAMLAFLWQDAGATQQEILAGMQVKFARLIKARQTEREERD